MIKVEEKLDVTPVALTDDLTSMTDYTRSAEGRVAIERGSADIESRSGARYADAFRDDLNWFCEVVASQPRIGKQDHGYDTTLYGIPHNVNWIFFQFDDAEARF